jgi:hypothetical protein
MDQDRQIHTTQQKKFKKMLRKTAKSRILIASQHFSMALLWRQLHRDFLRFAKLARSDGVVIFTSLRKTSTRYYALFRLLRASAVQKV